MKRRLQTTHLLICCWLLAAAGAFAQTPVASYSFSGSAKDQSSFANHGSINGATITQDRFGLPNSAFFFNGIQGAIRAENADQLNSPNATISFWVNPAAFPAQGEAYLVSFGGYQERFKISLPGHGKPVFTTHAGGACCSDMDSGTPLTIGVWTHVVMVHDGAKDIIYFNGVQVNEKNVAGALDATTLPLGIGYDPINNSEFFNGSLDEVQLFDVALTATQIAALYTAQNTAPVVTLDEVANYNFDGNGADNTAFGNAANVSSGSLTTDRFGYGNSALLIDESSSVTASNGAQLNSATTTISFWVKPNAFPAQGEAYLLSLGGYQERFKISLPGHGKPVFTTHSGGACCSDLDSGTPLTIGAWTHVVMVHDGTKDIIYFNGAKVNEKAAAGALDATTKPLGIGFDPIDNNNRFDGALDDISIYNYALTEAAIVGLYAAQSAFPGTASDLVASYPLDPLDGNGNDVTQFGNDAELDASAAAVPNRFGWASNALSGYATADNSAALQSDYTTISFWVKPDAFPASGEVYLLSNGGYQERWKISLPGHGKPVFTTHSGGACCSDLDSGTPLTVGTWTHVVMVHDGAKDIIYFNGVKVNEKNATGTLDKTRYPLGIGYDPINNSDFFDGSLDDVLIYNRALTAVEIAALYAVQNAAPVVPGNLVAHYAFSFNGSDSTAYNNHSTGSGQLGKDRFGKASKAASFNGSTTKVTVPNSPQLNSPYTTISFWVNPNAFPASGEVYLLSHGGYQERWKISLPGHGKPVFTTHSNGACCSDLDSGTPLTVGTWTHVVMVHDGAKDIIYFNGVRVNERNTVGTLDVTTKPLGIGYDPIDDNYVFDGLLDEVQIYKVALTDAEIAALYAAQSQLPASTDIEAPCAPLNLAAEVNFTNVLLTWLPAVDNVGVETYNVYQDGVLIFTTSDLQAALSDLTPLTEFYFEVSAVDAEGNESLPSSLFVISGEDETPDITPPTAPGNLTGATGATSVLLSWDASTDDRILAGYAVFVDGVLFDSLVATATSVLINGLDPETPYSFEIYAFDNAGNNSDTSEITLTTDQEINTGEVGLVAWYPFEGNANDATPYNNHGVIGGNPVFEPATHPNGGGQNIKFDGDQDSVLAPNAVQLISDYTTVSFWIRVDGINPADAEAYILDFGHWSERWKISLPQHTKIVWTTNGNNAQFPVFIHDMDSGDGNELVVGFWWYVTMVHDGTNDIIYINGEQVNSQPTDTELNSTGRPLGMGNNPIDGGQYFNGALDELKIYNKALTAEEIAQLYDTGTTGTKDDLSVALLQLVHDVYPNPATNLLWVKHSFDGQQPLLLRISDLLGRQVGDLRFGKNEVPADQFSVNVNDYPAGTYFLNFVVGGKSIGSVKFTKK